MSRFSTDRLRWRHAGRGRRAGRGVGARAPRPRPRRRSRSSAGSPGWPGTSTWPAATAFTAHGIESWEFDVLAALRRAGRAVRALPGPAAPRDAGDQRHDDQPRRPAGRARASSSGYPDPDDRRGVIVRLTAEGKAAVDGAFERAARRPSRPARRPARARPQTRLAGAAAPAARAVRADRAALRAGSRRAASARLEPLQLELVLLGGELARAAAPSSASRS